MYCLKEFLCILIYFFIYGYIWCIEEVLCVLIHVFILLQRGALCSNTCVYTTPKRCFVFYYMCSYYSKEVLCVLIQCLYYYTEFLCILIHVFILLQRGSLYYHTCVYTTPKRFFVLSIMCLYYSKEVLCIINHVFILLQRGSLYFNTCLYIMLKRAPLYFILIHVYIYYPWLYCMFVSNKH